MGHIWDTDNTAACRRDFRCADYFILGPVGLLGDYVRSEGRNQIQRCFLVE